MSAMSTSPYDPAMHSVIRILTIATLAGGLALASGPALAQGPGPDPTVYRFDLPGSVKAGATKFTLPGDLTTRKSRGDKPLGSMPIAEVVTEVTDLKAKGHSVGGTITIAGKAREMKGIPQVLASGRVKVRVTQARGTRAIILRGNGGGSGTVTSCPPNSHPVQKSNGTITCEQDNSRSNPGTKDAHDDEHPDSGHGKGGT